MKNVIIINNEAIINAEGKKNSKHCKPVVCIAVDGSEFRSFSSIEDAATKLDINRGYISTCMTKGKPCKGYKFYDTKNAASLLGEMAAIINKNAVDAKKYRKIEAEQEAIRKAEEERQKAEAKRQAAIEKARAKVAKKEVACSNLEAKLMQAEAEYVEAERELAALLAETEIEILEEAA